MSTPLPTINTAPLTFPSPSTLPVLLGRSNYTAWYSAIKPLLALHPLTRALLSGSWTEPRRPISFSTAPAPNTNPITTDIEPHAHALVAWDHANLTTCRFIRDTLAMNVVPFVRRYSEAKALWDALVRLYGAGNGIAMAGGPAISRIEPVGEMDVGAGDSVYGAGDNGIVGFAKGKGKGKGREVAGGLGRETG
jgi:hypothetical protein